MAPREPTHGPSRTRSTRATSHVAGKGRRTRGAAAGGRGLGCLCACVLRPARGPGFKETGTTTVVAARGLWAPGPGLRRRQAQAGEGAARPGPACGERGAAEVRGSARPGSQPRGLLPRPPARRARGTPSVTWRPREPRGLAPRTPRPTPGGKGAPAGFLWPGPPSAARVGALRTGRAFLFPPRPLQPSPGLCSGRPRPPAAPAGGRYLPKGRPLRERRPRGSHFPARLRSGLNGFPSRLLQEMLSGGRAGACEARRGSPNGSEPPGGQRLPDPAEEGARQCLPTPHPPRLLGVLGGEAL